MLDRRAFFATLGAGFGAAWLAARPEDLDASLKAALERPPLEILTPEQAADVEAVAAQIIPTDDLPGAREAGVVNFVDKALGTWAQDHKRDFFELMTQFNALVAQHNAPAQRFAQLAGPQQVEFLAANEHHPFFEQAMIFLTVAGTFAHPDWGGNQDKAGWRILGFQDAYVWQPPFGWYDDKANGGPN